MRRLAGASVVAMLLAASPARADVAATLETAKAAVDGSDYLTARAQLTELTNHGNNGPEDMAEIYRLTGIVAGALGEAKPATEAFERCLALTPRATLPPGSSPKIAKPFAAAQAYFKTHEPLKIKADTKVTPPTLTLSIVSDPLSMISSTSVLATVDSKPPQSFQKPAAPEITIELSPGGRIDLRVIALDAHGNRLAEVGSLDVPLVIVGSGPVESGPKPPPQGHPQQKRTVVHVPAKSRPLYLKWWLWGGTSVALAAGATYFAFGARSAKLDLDNLNPHSVEHNFDEARAIENRGKRDALLTNIGYGVAGGFAVFATILYLTSPRSHDEQRVTTTLTPVPIRGGGAVVLGVPF